MFWSGGPEGSSRYGKRAARASSSSCTKGESENRTDFGEGATGPPVAPRRDFLRKEEEEAFRGLSEACAKSSERAGSLGWEMVAEAEDVGCPRNWEARSSYCFCNCISDSWRLADALVDLSAWI